MRRSPLPLVRTAILSTFAAFVLLPGYGNIPAYAQANKRLQQTTVAAKPDKAQEPRLALVIGNGEYGGNELKNPVNDAKAMAVVLKRQGFVVVEKENLSQTEMLDAIRAFGTKLQATPGATALFYFSGHGLQVGGQNWLVPIAHGIHGERDVPDKAVSAQRVLDQMAGGRLNIVILDACRDNPFIPAKSLGKGLAKMDAPAGTLIAYATAPGKTADDNPDAANGLYTQELLKQMQMPGLKIEDVFKKTRVQVKSRSKGQQLPWEESSLENDFYFVPMRNKPNKTDKTDELPATKINSQDDAEMVLISAGEFPMGDNDQADNPRHTVTLSAYYMYQNMVTVEQYLKFCAATGYPQPPAPDFNPNWSLKDHPIVNVTYADALKYCAWASRENVKVTLPTEAQWEKAARGTDGRNFPWGNMFDASRLRHSNATFGDAGGTAPVGSFMNGASPFGILDMAGNAWQWCMDYYNEGYWKNQSASDPKGPSVGNERVVRGAAWYTIGEAGFRTSFRGKFAPETGLDRIGFRCAASVQVPLDANPKRPHSSAKPVMQDGAELVYIPAGEFTMGSTEAEVNALLAAEPRVNREKLISEVGRHRVYLDSYYIYKTPVTVKQYKHFCAITGKQMPPAPEFNPGWSSDDQPMSRLTWEDAQAYCTWVGALLPTEAQWEKAARGTEGRKFPWGDSFDGNRLRHSKNSIGDAGGPVSTGNYPNGASPYGVLDMAGNIYQWCADWYDEKYYQTSPSRNPLGPPSGSGHVLRGGGWGDYLEANFRCASRDLGGPGLKFYIGGFRCVVPADAQ